MSNGSEASPEGGHDAPAPGAAGAAAPAPRAGLAGRFLEIRDAAYRYCTPPELEHDSEGSRRARLITGFGLLGLFFGAAYATFYYLIGHIVGANIIVACSIGVAMAPLVMRWTGSTRVAGNLLVLILLLGFGALCGIEGGIRGHAIGWLAAVPLCALLLIDGPETAAWCGISLAVTLFYVIMDYDGFRLTLAYPAQWHRTVTAAGYLGLTAFMFTLGLIFEGGRRRAFGRMENALRDVSVSNARLKKLDGEKNEFLGVAAHDLKNPLNIIMGFAELIASGRNKITGRDQEDARYIIQATERMITLITELLDVNAIEQGHFPIEISQCDLAAISRQVLAGYSGAAEKKQLSVFAAGTAEPVYVMADSKAAYRIIDNLFSNAVKYSPAGRDIFVRVRNSPEGVMWEVQDQGAGLTEADQAKLFQKFTKLSARPTGGESSTGLGLSIVRMLAQQMHGAITCRSKHGEGATFILRLPAAPEPPIHAATVEELPAPPEQHHAAA